MPPMQLEAKSASARFRSDEVRPSPWPTASIATVATPLRAISERLDVRAGVAVPVERDREWLVMRRVFLRNDDDDRDEIAMRRRLGRERAERPVVVRSGIARIAGEEGRFEVCDHDVVDVVVRVEQRGDAIRIDAERRGRERRERIVQRRPRNGRDVGRARITVNARRAAHRRHDVEIWGELVGEEGEAAAAIETLAQLDQILRDRLRRERPRERDAVEPARREVSVDLRVVREEARQARDGCDLRDVMNGIEGRAHRLTRVADETIREHDRVLVTLAQREHRTKHQRVRLALPEPHHVVVGLFGRRVARAVERIRMIEHSVPVGVLAWVHHAVAIEVLFDALEKDLRFEAARVVGVIAIRLGSDVVERARVDVDRDGNARLEIDDVDGVALEVGLAEATAALAIDQVLEIERRIERDAHGRVGAPSVHLAKFGAHARLERGRRDEARVDASARGRARIRDGRDVVRQRDLGQRARVQIPADLRTVTPGRVPERRRKSAAVAREQQTNRRGEKEASEVGAHPSTS